MAVKFHNVYDYTIVQCGHAYICHTDLSNVGEIGLHFYGNFWPKIDVLVLFLATGIFVYFYWLSLNFPMFPWPIPMFSQRFVFIG